MKKAKKQQKQTFKNKKINEYVSIYYSKEVVVIENTKSPNEKQEVFLKLATLNEINKVLKRR